MCLMNDCNDPESAFSQEEEHPIRIPKPPRERQTIAEYISRYNLDAVDSRRNAVIFSLFFLLAALGSGNATPYHAGPICFGLGSLALGRAAYGNYRKAFAAKSKIKNLQQCNPLALCVEFSRIESMASEDLKESIEEARQTLSG